MYIDSYDFGEMVVGGTRYTQDLIIFPDHIQNDWWRAEGHALGMSDLAAVIESKPAILIIGLGASSCMHISGDVKRACGSRGIQVIAENTHNAVRLFNEKSKDVHVVGAFHLTC